MTCVDSKLVNKLPRIAERDMSEVCSTADTELISNSGAALPNAMSVTAEKCVKCITYNN